MLLTSRWWLWFGTYNLANSDFDNGLLRDRISLYTNSAYWCGIKKLQNAIAKQLALQPTTISPLCFLTHNQPLSVFWWHIIFLRLSCFRQTFCPVFRHLGLNGWSFPVSAPVRSHNLGYWLNPTTFQSLEYGSPRLGDLQIIWES